MSQFDTSEQLHAWALEQGVLNDPHVRYHLQDLMWREVSMDLDLPPVSKEDPSPDQQSLEVLEKKKDRFLAEELQALTERGLSEEFDILSTQSDISENISVLPVVQQLSSDEISILTADALNVNFDPEKSEEPSVEPVKKKAKVQSDSPENTSGLSAVQHLSPDEISILTADALNDNFDPEKSKEPVEQVKKAMKSKYFECSRCQQTFRRIQMLREHRKKCQSEDGEETPPTKKFKQTTLTQYGGQAPSTKMWGC